MPLALQRGADGGNAAIHHIRRRNDIGPRRRLIEALPHQHFHGGVIQHIARGVDQPILPMRGIGIKRDIGEHADVIPAGILDGANGAAHQIIGVERLAAILAAALGLRVGEEREAGDAKAHRLFRARHDAIHAPARDAGQRGYRFLHARPLGDEQGPDEVRRGEGVLAVHRPAPAAGAGAAQAGGGKGGGGRCWRSGHTVGSRTSREEVGTDF